tara:strand:+ start:460 stop:1467 length:1008 start_codon:yes stop_codon:yes gene_type:complete
MNATILLNNEEHYPVLLDEILSIISPQNGGTFIDCTLGQGGYTNAILKFNEANVIAIDRDPDIKLIAQKIKLQNKNRFLFFNKKFSDIDKIQTKNYNIKAIIFDLGYSYTQIKDPKKGLSFESKGKLNMKLGLNSFSADEVINKLDQKDLELIFKYFGEEKDSKLISKKIVEHRLKSNLNTEKLVNIINSVKKKRGKTHNATKIFQAIRIFVNKEISELIYGLINSTKILGINGIILAVSFHSLEDRIIKYFLKSLSEDKKISRYFPEEKNHNKLFKLISKKPIFPSRKEISINKPSRSAKLRYGIKKKNIINFEKDILNKFSKLLEIENLSSKL